MARPRSDIEPRILHAARRRFLAEGVDGASLRTIARDAKTSVGMVFYYFPSKDELFLAVVEEVYGKLVEDLATALEGDGATRDRLQGAFARLGQATDDEVEVIRLVLREALLVPASPRFSRLMARFRQGHMAVALRTLARGVDEGELDDAVPLPLLMMTTVAMGALPQILRRVAGHEPPFSLLPPPEVLATTAVDLLFRGIGPRKPPRKRARRRA
ncbi:MAG TPA: TetR/AcrR family transcriptional regulator [Labilithrix sp.]|nr:TetR/AcrR family transcriptional regulator [Labilithrix sp.]